MLALSLQIEIPPFITDIEITLSSHIINYLLINSYYSRYSEVINISLDCQLIYTELVINF